MTDNIQDMSALPGADDICVQVDVALSRIMTARGLNKNGQGKGADISADRDGDEPEIHAGSEYTDRKYSDLSDDEKRSLLNMTDAGFATRLAHYSKDKCLYCPQLGWLIWDGNRYQSCEEKDTFARREVMRMEPKIKKIEYPAFKGLLPSHEDFIKAGGDKTLEGMTLKNKMKAGQKTLGRIWSRTTALGNDALQRSVLKVAAAMPEFYTDFDNLDDAPGLLNTLSGGLELPLNNPPVKSGDIDPAAAKAEAFKLMMSLAPSPLDKQSPRPKVTRVTGAKFNAKIFKAGDESAPLWAEHLKTLFPDPEMRAYFLRICGSMLVNWNPKRSWFIWRGRGNDGKSTTLRILGDVLGDYWTIGDVLTLMSNPNSSASGPRNDLMALAGGTRLVSFVEPDDKQELDAGVIKKITGGDGMSTRGNHQTQKVWMPQFKMTLLCNDLPKVKDSSDGFWQRVMIVPFTHQFTKATEDPTLEGRIKAERDGILNSLIEGFYDWRSRGFNFDPPQVSEDMKLRFQDESSQYLAWQRERILWGGWYNRDAYRDEDYNAYSMFVRPESGGHQDAIQIAREYYWCDDESVCRAARYNPSEIYDDYLAWCDGDGLTPWRSGTFLKKFKTDALDKGCVWKKTGADGRHWRGFDFIDGHAHTAPDDNKKSDDDAAMRGGFM